MPKFNDALKSKGRIKLSAALDELKRHAKVKDGRMEFTPPPDLDEATAGMLTKSVTALNDLVAAGLVKVSADGKVEA